jgi:hypothetical protein
MANRDWDEFWGIAWGHLFHALGMISVVGFFAFIVWGLASGNFDRSEVRSNEDTDSDRKATQALFHKALLNAPKPCAVKGKKFSDIKNCTVFGLGLGMPLNEVTEALDGSGYFARKASFIKGCHNQDSRCVGYTYMKTDNFSVSADFMPAWEGDTTRLSVTDINLRVNLRTLPYVAPENMRATFATLFGAPDQVIGTTDLWGGAIETSLGARIKAYPHEGNYVVTISDQGAPEKKQP